jgi:signal transduction histidine kinase
MGVGGLMLLVVFACACGNEPLVSSSSPAAIDAPLVENLLSNAVKYSPAGSHVHFKVWGDGPDMVFEVRDEGIGIPLADQERLFETFQRGSNVGAAAGNGLGLSIVKRAVDLHGGRLEVESKVGVGTRFTVRLPCARSAA